jgi:hypothetical protein
LNELGANPLKEWEAFDYNFDPKNPAIVFSMVDGSCLLVNSSRDSINALSLRSKGLLTGLQPHFLTGHYQLA